MTTTPPAVLVLHNDERESAELQILLERNIASCKTSVTWSGLEALKLLQAGHFNVLVTDDYAPDLFIGDLIERAAALPSPPQVFVLGEDSPASAVARYQNLGMCRILEKQRPRTLLQAISAGSAWTQSRAPAPTKDFAKGSPQAPEARRVN